MSSSDLVFLSEDKTPVTSTEIIARALEKDHKDVMALARKYKADLEEFGAASFKTNLVRRGSGARDQEKEIALLNEQQATLLITYMRNSEKVRKFKIALVKAFFEMREQLTDEKLFKYKEDVRKLRHLNGKSKLSNFEMSCVSDSVHVTAKALNKTAPEIFHLLYTRFHVPSYKCLNPEDVPEVLSWLGELAKGHKLSRKIHFTDAHRLALQFVADFGKLYSDRLAELEEALNNLRLVDLESERLKKFAGLVHSIRGEFALRKNALNDMCLMVSSIPLYRDRKEPIMKTGKTH